MRAICNKMQQHILRIQNVSLLPGADVGIGRTPRTAHTAGTIAGPQKRISHHPATHRQSQQNEPAISSDRYLDNIPLGIFDGTFVETIAGDARPVYNHITIPTESGGKTIHTLLVSD